MAEAERRLPSISFYSGMYDRRDEPTNSELDQDESSIRNFGKFEKQL